MAGATNLAYRMLCRRFGAGLTVTEMVSAKALSFHDGKTWALLEHTPAENPLSAQIFGTDPAEMAEAARAVEGAGFHLVDVNMGCPVPKIAGSGAGCSLMRDPRDAAAVVGAMARAVSIPVTVKMRAGWDDGERNAPAVARAVADAGAAAVTVHGRTRSQLYSGRADLTIIAEVRGAVPVPVFGNGDVDSPAKAVRMFRETGCDGIVIGRGALGSPWIFRDILAALRGESVPPPPAAEEVRDLLLELARGLVAVRGEFTGARLMRKLACDFARGFRDGARFREGAIRVESLEDLERLARGFFTPDRPRTPRAGDGAPLPETAAA
jgi:nifR3 family TIM-barrel protein